jgi:hypothetical protein
MSALLFNHPLNVRRREEFQSLAAFVFDRR